MSLFDTERLSWLSQHIEGFACLDKDVHEYAIEMAEEYGHEEPDNCDYAVGFRNMVDDAMKCDPDLKQEIKQRSNK